MKLARRKHVERGDNGRLVSKGVVSLKERAADFWAQVDKEDDCWLWTGKKNPRHAYGQFYVGWDGIRYRELRAHRAVWMLTHGSIGRGQDVLHTCDNPLCVRPEHLFIGDKSANMKDAASKGRLHWQKWKEESERIKTLFTREDVELLRDEAERIDGDYESNQGAPGYTQSHRHEFDEAILAFNNLADRIEALLPPDK